MTTVKQCKSMKDINVIKGGNVPLKDHTENPQFGVTLKVMFASSKNCTNQSESLKFYHLCSFPVHSTPPRNTHTHTHTIGTNNYS